MEFFEVIRTRESIRSYDPLHPVSKEVLIRILEVGRLAPSAANRQPWKFRLISSEENLAKVKICYEKPWFQDAPHILVVVGNRQESWVRRSDDRNFIETDLAIALVHIILAAANEGVGTCWISNFKPDSLRKVLELKEYEYVFGISPLGYPKSDYVKNNLKDRKAFDAIVEWQ
jgi:nitroreductase